MDQRGFLRRRTLFASGLVPITASWQTAATRDGKIYTTDDGWITNVLKQDLFQGTNWTLDVSDILMAPHYYYPESQVIICRGANRYFYTTDRWTTYGWGYLNENTQVTAPDGVYEGYPYCYNRAKKDSWRQPVIACGFSNLSPDYLGVGYVDLPNKTSTFDIASGKGAGMTWEYIATNPIDINSGNPGIKGYLFSRISSQGLQTILRITADNVFSVEVEHNMDAESLIYNSVDDSYFVTVSPSSRTLNYWQFLPGTPSSVKALGAQVFAGNINNYVCNAVSSNYAGVSQLTQLVATSAGLYRTKGQDLVDPATSLIPETAGKKIMDCDISKNELIQSCVCSGGYIYTTPDDWRTVYERKNMDPMDWAKIIVA